MRPSLRFLASLAGVVVCGAIGGVAGWVVVASIGLSGVAGALLAAVAGMAIAVAAWITVTAIAGRLIQRR
jgi:hypothetical protein